MRFRRALVLLGMTLVVPGSAQLVCGNRTVGRVAVRIWAALVVLALLAGLAIWLDSTFAVQLATDPSALLVLRVGLTVGAVGWVLLLLDAWRLGEPPSMPRGSRLALAGVSAALVAGLTAPLLMSAQVVAVQRDVLLEVFGDGTAVDAADGRYNVLLLGGDSGAERWGVRPDSVTLASVDAETGRTVLLSLPRNLENVPFPDDSPMADKFPNGFDCDGCYLNGVYTYARTHRTLFPGVENPGLEATVQAVETITGLPVHYYAMVNMRGFAKLVDAVGGVTLRVRTEIAIGGGTGDITGTIEPGVHRLDGEETLWYARSRAFDDDYSRMGRQKCVMAAMLAQLDPRRVLMHVQDIARASAQLLSTDIPHQELDTFVGLALKARHEPITTVSFVPPMIDTYDPDYDLIAEKVDAAIARAESTAEPSGAGKTPGAAQSNRAVKAANHSDDLQSTC